MKKRILIALLCVGMVFQSLSLPVVAANKSTSAGETAVYATGDAAADPSVIPTANLQSEGESSTPEEMPTATPEENPSTETEGTPSGSEAGTTESPVPAQSPSAEPGSTTAPTPVQSPEAAESPTPSGNPAVSGSGSPVPEVLPTASVSPEASQSPSASASPEASGEPTPSVSVSPSLSPTPEGEMTGYIEGGEGVYQEGSFKVIGGPQEEITTFSARAVDPYAKAASYIYQQMLARTGTISLSGYGISINDISSVVFGVLNDHPDLYYVRSSFRYAYNSNYVITAIMPEYISGCDDALFQSAVEDALSSISSDMTDLEKAITLHDYLALNCEYDYDRLYNGTIPNESYSAYGILANHIGVCQGYALAYKLLLNKAGIECYMVTSDEMNHAWNLVVLDGEYYQVDVTWDDPVRDRLGRVDHEYMFCSDADFMGAANPHYGWVITSGSQEVDYTAEDTTYDTAFWESVLTPIVIQNNSFYYIDNNSKSILKRSGVEGVETTLLSSVGTWYVWNSYSYYSGAFSGLFLLNGRLYYNTPNRICSIPLEGGSAREETVLLSDETGYVYGSAFRQGQVYYTLSQSYSPSGNIYTAELTGPIAATKIELSEEELLLNQGESVTLTAQIYPSYSTEKDINWATSDAKVATVTGGVVKAVGGGTCTISATVGEVSAFCQVTVIRQLDSPVFTPAEGTIDLGSQVSLASAQDAEIYYTVNGSEPVPGARGTLLYTEPLIFWEDTVIKAVAVSESDAFADSETASASYQVCTNNLLLDIEQVTLTEGESLSLEVLEVPTTKSVQDVTFTSSAAGTAAVDADGVITAVWEGTAIITAAVTDHQGRVVTAEVEVQVEAPLYQVTFYGMDPTRPVKTETVKAREAAVPPAREDFRVPEGYSFADWDRDSSYVTQDMTIYALYDLITYQITYETNGGSLAAGSPESYTIETDSIELPDAYGKSGYRFTGWYTNEELEGNRIYTIEKGSTGDLILYAGWADERGLWMETIEPKEYTGKAIKPEVQVYYGDQKLTAGTDYTVSYQNNTAANTLETEAQLKKAPTVKIKGKGNYSGTLTSIFQILPKSLSDEDVQADDLAAAYNKGKTVKPSPVVKWNSKKLTTKDYTVEWPDSEENEDAYKQPGTYTVRLTGKGNYTGTRELSLTIADPETEILLSKVKISKIPDQTYTGEPVTLTADMPKLTYQNRQLLPGEDYDLTYGECKEIGTYEVIITGKGSYTGIRRVTFKIKGIAASKMKVGKLASRVYTGEEITFDPGAAEGAIEKLTITAADGTPLQEGTDYELAYEKNTAVGTAKLIITGIGANTGKVTKTFKITAASLKEENPEVTVSLAADEPVAFEKGGAKPKVTVTYRGTLLTEGTDYTLSYSNHTSVVQKAGKVPTITIKGRKNFKDSQKLTFTIARQDLSNVTITAPDMTENSKAGKYTSVPVLTDANGKKLSAGTDYEKKYVYLDANGMVLDSKDRPVAGTTLTVVVQGKGNYAGETSATFRILAKNKNISSAKVTFGTKYYYTGSAVTPAKEDMTVKIGSTVLNPGDYKIISCTNNMAKGTAKLTIAGIGEYGGTKQVTFKILPQIMQWWLDT